MIQQVKNPYLDTKHDYTDIYKDKNGMYLKFPRLQLPKKGMAKKMGVMFTTFSNFNTKLDQFGTIKLTKIY